MIGFGALALERAFFVLGFGASSAVTSPTSVTSSAMMAPSDFAQFVARSRASGEVEFADGEEEP